MSVDASAQAAARNLVTTAHNARGAPNWRPAHEPS
jgi:hypothetical protein